MFKLNSPLALKTGLEALTRVHGARQITTTFKGTTASTDYKNINLPALPMTAELSKNELAIFRGYHGHEVGHILYTKKNQYNDFVNDNFSITNLDNPTGKISPLHMNRAGIEKHEEYRIAVRKMHTFHRIWNFLEDPMIEKKLIKRFAGLHVALNATVESVVRGSNDARRKGARNEADYDPRETLCFAFNLHNRLLIDIGGKEVEEYLSNLPSDIEPLFQSLKKEMSNVGSTLAACKKALKLFELLWDAKEFKDQQQQQEEGNDNEEANEQGSPNGDASGRMGDEADKGEDKDPTAGHGDSDGGHEDRNQVGDPTEHKEQETQDEAPTSTETESSQNRSVQDLDPFKTGCDAGGMEKSVEKIADEHHEFNPDPSISTDYSSRATLRYTSHPVYVATNADMANGNITRQILSRKYVSGVPDYTLDYKGKNEVQWEEITLPDGSVKQKMKTKPLDQAYQDEEESWLKNLSQADRASINSLARKLQAREKIVVERGKKTGRLDASRLYGIAAGDHNVFLKKSHTQAYSTAVSVYVDMSGSVKPMRMANAMAALNEALGMGGIPTEIATWCEDCAYDPNGLEVAGGNETCRILKIKAWHENYKTARSDLLMQRYMMGGGTYCVEAYWHGCQSLLERNEQRKIMFFLMDGHGSSGLNSAYESPKRAMQYSQVVAASMGIETIGVGVGFDLGQYLKGSIRTDFRNLAADMLSTISEYFDKQGDYEAA